MWHPQTSLTVSPCSVLESVYMTFLQQCAYEASIVMTSQSSPLARVTTGTLPDSQVVCNASVSSKEKAQHLLSVAALVIRLLIDNVSES